MAAINLCLVFKLMSKTLPGEDQQHKISRRRKSRSSKRKAGDHHYATLFLLPAEYQVYVIHALNQHEHGQVDPSEMMTMIDMLRNTGFSELSGDWVDATDRRPGKYFLVLTPDRDWNIPEVAVMNRFRDHPYLMGHVGAINMHGIAHSLLVERWEDLKCLLVNKRMNIQLNVGSNNLDINDGDRIPGMNIARSHQLPKKIEPGLDGQKNMEDTVIGKQVHVTAIFDYVMDYFGRERIVSTCEWRRIPFSYTEMTRRNLNPDWWRTDCVAWLYSGPLMTPVHGVMTAKCNFHFDKNNDNRAEHGADVNACYSQLVPMAFPNVPSPVWGRCCFNQFNKRCNGDVMDKIQGTKKLVQKVREFMAFAGMTAESSKAIDWQQKMKDVRRVAREQGGGCAVLPAHANKDCHYSWFTHVILSEVVPIYGWNEYVIVELLFCMSFTPSSYGWRQGVRYALNARNNGRNLWENFVREMVFRHESVAHHFGRRGRHQVSSRGTIDRWQGYSSVYNLMWLFRRAGYDDCDSRALYEDVASHVFHGRRGRMRGVHGVQELTGHDIINVATHVGAVTNTTHIGRVGIARGTETARRLERFGIITDAHRREVIIVLSRELQIDDYQIVENIVCETLRWMEGDQTGKFVGVDTIAVDQPLYTFVGGVLHVIGANGCAGQLDFEKFKREHPAKEYNPQFEWWGMNIDFPRWTLGDDCALVLSTKSKVLMEYRTPDPSMA